MIALWYTHIGCYALASGIWQVTKRVMSPDHMGGLDLTIYVAGDSQAAMTDEGSFVQKLHPSRSWWCRGLDAGSGSPQDTECEDQHRQLWTCPLPGCPGLAAPASASARKGQALLATGSSVVPM